MIHIKYKLITPFKMSLYKFKLDAYDKNDKNDQCDQNW